MAPDRAGRTCPASVGPSQCPDRPPFGDHPEPGDLIVVGFGGDDLPAYVHRLVAHVRAVVGDGDDLPDHVAWPEGRPVWPTSFAVGTVERVVACRPVEFRDMTGRCRPTAGAAGWHTVHWQRFTQPHIALVFAAAAPSYLAAEDVLDQYANRPR